MSPTDIETLARRAGAAARDLGRDADTEEALRRVTAAVPRPAGARTAHRALAVAALVAVLVATVTLAVVTTRRGGPQPMATLGSGRPTATAPRRPTTVAGPPLSPLRVVPSGAVADGRRATIAARDLRPGTGLVLMTCTTDAAHACAAVGTDPAVPVVAADGRARFAARLWRWIPAGAAYLDCAAVPCRFEVRARTAVASLGASERLRFRSGGAAPPLPTLAHDPATTVRLGQRVLLSGTGYPPSSPVTVQLCTVGSAAVATCTDLAPGGATVPGGPGWPITTATGALRLSLPYDPAALGSAPDPSTPCRNVGSRCWVQVILVQPAGRVDVRPSILPRPFVLTVR